MATYVVELCDPFGHSFSLQVKLPFVRSSDGTWRSLAEGFIRYRKGKVLRRQFEGHEDSSLLLYNEKDELGIHLYEFEDFWGANAEGAGYVRQSWVIGMEPGNISWELVE
jgi:hypothetical protein